MILFDIFNGPKPLDEGTHVLFNHTEIGPLDNSPITSLSSSVYAYNNILTIKYDQIPKKVVFHGYIVQGKIQTINEVTVTVFTHIANR